MANQLVGQDHTYPDLVAKVTGRARYAEDFRAEGMLFAKLLLSPMPHARVRRIDARRALEMDGVVDVLTADDLAVKPEPPGEAPLTNEPLYEGEPILAVAAVDETTAADAVEAIRVDLEPLPFVLDPLESLKPGGPNAWGEWNTYDGRDLATVKWTQEDFDRAGPDGFPMGEPMIDWGWGEMDEAFAASDLVLEETLYHQSMTHHPMEPRTCMAYWQNGKVHVFGSTQSVARTRNALASSLDMDPEDVILVSEFCGGGFGSKIYGSYVMQIPALLSRKTGRPVMMRITRAEETFVGRARAGFQGSVRMGFSSDGRCRAIDLYLVQDNGPYSRQGDLFMAGNVASLAYQPDAFRLRGVPVITNTPPRSAQRAPGGAQITALLEPIMDKAAWELGVDRVEIRKVNAPGHDATFGPGREATLTSSFSREALDAGAEAFGWYEKQALSGRRNGTKVTGIGLGYAPFVGGSSGYDGLLVIRPDGKLYVHQGIGNLGTHSVIDTARVAADELGVPWERCEVVFGDTGKNLPWSSSQSGSQTTHAHTRANHAAAARAKELIAEMGMGTGDLAAVGRRAIELGGRFDGHEIPEDLHDMTKASVARLAGSGLVAAARDNYRHEDGTWSFVVGFALVELDVETGQVEIKEYCASTDCGVVMNPRSLAAQLHGGGVQGFGIARSQRWVYDPRWGVSFATRFYTARPPGIQDVPSRMTWVAVGEPDPQTPVGAKGIGEPPIGAGEAAVLSAIADALGGECLCRTPLTSDMILAHLEGRPQPYHPFEIHV